MGSSTDDLNAGSVAELEREKLVAEFRFREKELELEREKMHAELRLREADLEIRSREQLTKENEVTLKKEEHLASRWRNPLTVALFAAAIAGLGNAVVASMNSSAQVMLESAKAEQARILEVVKTGDPDRAAVNLQFLLSAGLIRDVSIQADLRSYLKARKPGEGAALPLASHSSADVLSQRSIDDKLVICETERRTGSSKAEGDKKFAECLAGQLSPPHIRSPK